jgi:integrase
MNAKQVHLLFSVLESRERLIAGLALLAGMQAGEIFGLTWGQLEADYADIRQRVYRGEVDSPKSVRSSRWAALPAGLLAAVDEWRSLSRDTNRGAWFFPSQNLERPCRKTIAGSATSCPSSNPLVWSGPIFK